MKTIKLLGVTLLEIMLVMAIASMVIIMSVRYYQSATASQQTNAILDQINGIVAAADGLAQSQGSYASALAGGASAVLAPILPAHGLTTPWSTPITVAAPSASTLSLTLGTVPVAVCALLLSKLSANSHFTAITPCSATAINIAMTYSS